MPKNDEIVIIEITPGNVAKEGLFCAEKHKDWPGYSDKTKWLKTRMADGLTLKRIKSGGRGVIEYIPAEYAWRPVDAPGYMFMHCLWVTGSKRNAGCATSLLNECIADAKAAKMKGIVTISSEGHFSIGSRFLISRGFELVDEFGFGTGVSRNINSGSGTRTSRNNSINFGLWVMKFKRAKNPSFAGDWDKKLKKAGKGITVFTSDQCPYFERGVDMIVRLANEAGIKCKVIKLKSAKDVRAKSPSPYGTFAIVKDEQLISYFPPGEKPLRMLLGI